MYEFKCNKCGHKFEELVFSSSFALDKLTCPACGFPHPEKLMSAVSLSGTGSSAEGG